MNQRTGDTALTREIKAEVRRSLRVRRRGGRRKDLLRGYVHSTNRSQNIVGIGVGPKIVAGRRTLDWAARVYVLQKLPLSVVGRGRVPARIAGVPTDVIQTGPFRALSATTAATRARARPVTPGLSVGFRDGSRLVTGTLGPIVARNGRSYLLSNNHVLAFENRRALGAPILQPGPLDGGTGPGDVIATLAQYWPLKASGNRVDVALAEFTGLATATSLPGVPGLATATPLAPTLGLQVEKIGRGTGHTHGLVDDVSADFSVRFSQKWYRFDDQILIAGLDGQFATEGDSGALVASTGSRHAVGLVFSGSSSFVGVNPMHDVLNVLGVSLVT